ncbi:hypothetical protein QJS66_23535 (plasmid) [Kocuria rhizophila]|nr:hypothetical protein QJS66_23535 [Kocuria rhizophila]
MVGAAAINIIVFGVLAALHTTWSRSHHQTWTSPMLFSPPSSPTSWKLAKPFRSLAEMVSPSSVKRPMHGASNLNPLGMATAMGASALLQRRPSSKQSAPDSAGV